MTKMTRILSAALEMVSAMTRKKHHSFLVDGRCYRFHGSSVMEDKSGCRQDAGFLSCSPGPGWIDGFLQISKNSGMGIGVVGPWRVSLMARVFGSDFFEPLKFVDPSLRRRCIDYRKFSENNLATLNSPVAVPPLWYSGRYGWVQLNGSIRQPTSRNIIEAVAVNARVVLPGDRDYAPGKKYLSSIRIENMVYLESAMNLLKAPEWPEEVFGKLDADKIARGKTHYEAKCACCHRPELERTCEHGERFLNLRTFPVWEVGTGPSSRRSRFVACAIRPQAFGECSSSRPSAVAWANDRPIAWQYSAQRPGFAEAGCGEESLGLAPALEAKSNSAGWAFDRHAGRPYGPGPCRCGDARRTLRGFGVD
jgi:hypothetical protein